MNNATTGTLLMDIEMNATCHVWLRYGHMTRGKNHSSSTGRHKQWLCDESRPVSLHWLNIKTLQRANILVCQLHNCKQKMDLVMLSFSPWKAWEDKLVIRNVFRTTVSGYVISSLDGDAKIQRSLPDWMTS